MQLSPQGRRPFYLSPHFTLEEMLESETAEARHISNQLAVGGNKADAQIIENLKALCLNVLEPLREAYGKPIDINSGYRSHRLNYIIGGSPTSQHLKGQACDILQKRGGQKEHLKLFHLIQSLGLPFDQLIWEQGGVWIHVSYRADGKNRRQIIYR